MIGVIIRREFTEWWRDRRLKWLGLGCTALIVVVALTGLQSTLRVMEDRQAAIVKETSNFLDQGDKNPHAAAHFGQYAFRPLLLPSAIDPGVSPWMGSMVWMEAHRRNLAEFRPADDGAGHRLAASLSVAWVLQTVVPLMLVMLGFAAIVGERERQTLPLLLSQGLPLSRLALAKGVALMGVLLGVLLPLALAVIVGYQLAPISFALGDGGFRLGLLGLIYLLYFLGLVGLVLSVSLSARSSHAALGVLLVFWVTLVVLLPRLATDVAAARHPVPSASEFWEGIQRGEGLPEGASDIAAERAAALRTQLAAELLSRFEVTRLEDLPVNFTAVYLQRLEEADEPIFEHAYGKLWQQQERQREARTTLGLLSPAIPLRELSMALAGTDPFALKHFTDAAELHRRTLIRALNEKQARDGAGQAFYVAAADTWQQMPAFSYTPPSAREVLQRHSRDLLLLWLWAMLPLGVALTLASRPGQLR